ncbi:MAG TPA: hypothetical protein PLT09_06445 [Deltaproteobacteria bacterium]|nr:hypothetical protein [Deltaproteobacteria bacterium]HPR54112.1 hypothetical protein [Deltaproteobacteria bacterium]HXK47060.1 hypothetical protein [Deltaproteobacteria bacterium]
MNKSRIGILTGLVLFALILAGCGSEGGDSDDSGTITPGTELTLFTDKVKACTPYLEDSRPSTGDNNLEEWSGWDPEATDTVLGKLFDSGIGEDECLYTQLEILDSHIEMANTFSDQWDTSGTYTEGGVTAVVDTSVTYVTIPFLNTDSPPMERLMTLTDPAQGLNVHMAFAQTGTGQTVVSQYVKGDESGVYYAWFIGNKVGIWLASVTDRKVQIVWEGNTDEKTFKISECTDAAGFNWEVMGGGSISSSVAEMAFMARNHATNLSDDEYYLSLTLGALEDGDERTIHDFSTDPPGSTGVLAYITEGNSLCLGFLGVYEYPDDADDLAWED